MIQLFEHFFAKESLASNMHHAFTRSQKQIIIQACMISRENFGLVLVIFLSSAMI